MGEWNRSTTILALEKIRPELLGQPLCRRESRFLLGGHLSTGFNCHHCCLIIVDNLAPDMLNWLWSYPTDLNSKKEVLTRCK